MNKIKVFIDGQAGTTGLQLKSKLVNHPGVTLLEIEEDKRKDADARQRLMNESDVVFLCLPDAAAIEAVKLVTNPETVIIDASTAHRTADGWTYGFPELSDKHYDNSFVVCDKLHSLNSSRIRQTKKNYIAVIHKTLSFICILALVFIYFK